MSPSSGVPLLVTCEHASNAVPPPYRLLFADHEARLATHEGYDIGAAELAREIAGAYSAPVLSGESTRLLVDLNRSPRNRQGLFSAVTRELPEEERRRVVDRYWRPFREETAARLDRLIAEGPHPVLHLSIHSFTPVFKGEERRADVGLLYDPARRGDKAFCARFGSRLREGMPGLRVRMNYPYRGISDGHAPALRRVYPAGVYRGIELEFNQAIAEGGGEGWRRFRSAIVSALSVALEG